MMTADYPSLLDTVRKHVIAPGTEISDEELTQLQSQVAGITSKAERAEALLNLLKTKK